MNTFSMKTCFVCKSEFWSEKRVKTTRVNYNQDSNYNKNEQETENEEEKDWILFWKFLNVPQVEIDEYKREFYNKPKSLIETETELFSLCPKCSVVKGKILILQEQLESIQHQLEGFSHQLSTTIKNTQENKYNKNSSINTRQSERGKNNCHPNPKPNSNEGIQRLRQLISDQREKPSARVSKSKNSEENSHVLTNSNSISSLVPLDSGCTKEITTKEREDEREEFNVSDGENEGDDFLSSNIKQEVESESEGDHENPNEISQQENEEEEEENDKDAEGAENGDDLSDFFYGIYDFLSASIVDTNPNTSSDQDQDQNLNESINENENPSLENNNTPEPPEALDQPPRKKRKKGQTPEEWITNVQKRKRMLGEEYLMAQKVKRPDGSMKYFRQNVKPARVMGGPCRCAQGHPGVGKGRECGQIQEEERQLIFHKFWKTMDWDEKKMWVKSAVVVTRPKRRKHMIKKKKKKKPKKKGRGRRKRGVEENSASSDSNSADEMNVNVNVNPTEKGRKGQKEWTVKYFLPLRDHRKIVVCKPLFLSTLGIGEGNLHLWLKQSTESLKKKEQRLQSIRSQQEK